MTRGGCLYLLPNALALRATEPTPLANSLPNDVIALAATLDYFIGENAKSTRAFLKLVGTARPIQTIDIRELNAHTPRAALADLLAPIVAGRDAALVSEAGCPAIADPGADLVELAHARGIAVRPLIGPSSIILALMASGLNGQSFAFNGYLPTDPDARIERIRFYEDRARRERQTQLFIETPYRNDALFAALLAALHADTRLAIASDLSLPTETVRCRPVHEWRNHASTMIGKRPTVFSLLA